MRGGAWNGEARSLTCAPCPAIDAVPHASPDGAGETGHPSVGKRLRHDAAGMAALCFLRRRVAPAMRTCRSVEERQLNLSEKLARAATLLRTWVDVEVEKQNRDLLASMNNRARLQLRLQQTVEGLSVAAVSYYVVGLIGYVAKGAPRAAVAPHPPLPFRRRRWREVEPTARLLATNRPPPLPLPTRGRGSRRRCFRQDS